MAKTIEEVRAFFAELLGPTESKSLRSLCIDVNNWLNGKLDDKAMCAALDRAVASPLPFPSDAHPLYKYRREQGSVVGFQPADRLEMTERTVEKDRDYTTRELRFVLECICPDGNLTVPFQTTIAPDLLPIVTEAVRFFCNNVVEVVGTDHQTGRLVIKSPGHRFK